MLEFYNHSKHSGFSGSIILYLRITITRTNSLLFKGFITDLQKEFIAIISNRCESFFEFASNIYSAKPNILALLRCNELKFLRSCLVFLIVALLLTKLKLAR